MNTVQSCIVLAQVSLNIYYSYVGQINPKFQYSE